MKKYLLYLLLIFFVPHCIYAQFGGGTGRGEVTSIAGANPLNGPALNIYNGGRGRGENNTIVSSNALNGDSLAIYGGGNGRGEITTVINSNQLDGASSNIYGGGIGRGEFVADTNSLQLNGVFLNIYGGGIGRGEIYGSVNTLQLDGVSEVSMFLGGGGRGETSQQFNNIGLPVTLMSFSAALAGKEIKLQWQTASELNSAYFVVEKSLDGASWQSIGKVNAAGHSDLPLTYQFFDAHPVEGANYYRLKPTDLDNKFTYSAVALVRYHESSAAKIVVYPNPVKYQFTISIQGLQTTARLHISLVNAHGQTVFDKANLSSTTHTFDIAALAAGIYFLVIDNNGNISTAKIVKE